MHGNSYVTIKHASRWRAKKEEELSARIYFLRGGATSTLFLRWNVQVSRKEQERAKANGQANACTHAVRFDLPFPSPPPPSTIPLSSSPLSLPLLLLVLFLLLPVQMLHLLVQCYENSEHITFASSWINKRGNYAPLQSISFVTVLKKKRRARFE